MEKAKLEAGRGLLAHTAKETLETARSLIAGGKWNPAHSGAVYPTELLWKTVPEIIAGMQALFADPAKWGKKAFAVDATNRSVNPCDPKAVCWCMAGAMRREADYRPGNYSPTVRSVRFELLKAIRRRYSHRVWSSLAEFNDDPTTTHAMVLEVLAEARQHAE